MIPLVHILNQPQGAQCPHCTFLVLKISNKQTNKQTCSDLEMWKGVVCGELSVA